MHFRLAAILAVLVSRIGLASDVIISPNMGMPVPVVGQAPGPDWANDINASLSIIDSHDHTPGYGVQVPPAGLNINSDLTFQGNNATNLRSARFTAQGSPISGGSDLGALYVSGADLYYNDEAGNQVRITQGGSVTGSSGTITGLPSGTASASYSSPTFTFLSATNTPAIMSVGPVKIGTNAVSPKTVTLAPPAGLAANYNLTFPNGLPGSTSMLSVDTSGNMASVATTGSGSVVLATSPTITSPTISGANIGTTTITGGTFAGTIAGTPTFSGNFQVTGSPTFVNHTFFSDSLGINTTATAFRLEVDGSGADSVPVAIRAGTHAGVARQRFMPSDANTPYLEVDADFSSSPPHLVVGSDAATSLVIDRDNGNVGVRMTPTAPLDVAGAMKGSAGLTLSGTGGNTPHGCTRRLTSSSASSLIVTCSAGEIVVGGGCSNAISTLLDSYPDSTTSWRCTISATQTLTAYAICCSI